MGRKRKEGLGGTAGSNQSAVSSTQSASGSGGKPLSGERIWPRAQRWEKGSFLLPFVGKKEKGKRQRANGKNHLLLTANCRLNMTTSTTAQKVGTGTEIGLVAGSGQPALPTPKARFASPGPRVPSPDLGPAPVAVAKPCVVVMHYDLGTLD